MATPSANYANEDSFRVYVDYLALKRHFTTDNYDYHKYNGKTKASFQSYQTRNDAFFFYKLSKKKDWHNLILANMVENPNIWIRDLCDEEAEQKYIEWKKRKDALSYHFSSELNKIKEDLEENFVIESGAHPHLMNLYMKRKISKEFFAIITHVTNVFPYWENELSRDVVAADVIKLAKKYFPFLDIDKRKFTALLKSHVN